jgi:hypothetical protein
VRSALHEPLYAIEMRSELSHVRLFRSVTHVLCFDHLAHPLLVFGLSLSETRDMRAVLFQQLRDAVQMTREVG